MFYFWNYRGLSDFGVSTLEELHALYVSANEETKSKIDKFVARYLVKCWVSYSDSRIVLMVDNNVYELYLFNTADGKSNPFNDEEVYFDKVIHEMDVG